MQRKKSVSQRTPNTARHKSENFTAQIYGARVTFEDARQLDAYARKNRLSRSAAVRLAVHQFVLQQQFRVGHKDPTQVLREQVLAAQLAPLEAEITTLSAKLSELGAALSQTRPAAQKHPLAGLDGQSQPALGERILAIVALLLRLQVNFLVAPVLGQVLEANPAALEVYLADSAQGQAAWDTATRQLVACTEQRVWEELALEDLPSATSLAQLLQNQPAQRT